MFRANVIQVETDSYEKQHRYPETSGKLPISKSSVVLKLPENPRCCTAMTKVMAVFVFMAPLHTMMIFCN